MDMLKRVKLALLALVVATTSACFVFTDGAGNEWACDGSSPTNFSCAPTGRVIRATTPCVPLNGQGC
jgi:hypothetical protein